LADAAINQSSRSRRMACWFIIDQVESGGIGSVAAVRHHLSRRSREPAAMLIYNKTSTLAVRRVFDRAVMGSVAEAMVKDSAKVLGHIAEEAAGKIAGDWVKAVAERGSEPFHRPQ
jgi:hypothetical protein